MRTVSTHFHAPRAMIAIPAIGIAAVLMLIIANRSEDVVVLFPPEGLAEALPAGAAIVATAPMQLTIRGSAGLTEALYAAGATIVLNAGKGSCKAQSLP
ncbi:MAG: hypothetical protein OEM24_01480 [Paracoccaceae bacterium]|nr:hypothetical protein [Paracoccaceae bacterium]